MWTGGGILPYTVNALLARQKLIFSSAWLKSTDIWRATIRLVLALVMWLGIFERLQIRSAAHNGFSRGISAWGNWSCLLDFTSIAILMKLWCWFAQYFCYEGKYAHQNILWGRPWSISRYYLSTHKEWVRPGETSIRLGSFPAIFKHGTWYLPNRSLTYYCWLTQLSSLCA
jgi:hypothetical protein